ncbi:MAG: 16S rRNA (guanine(527)-N(7))-methyltransferase RsmG [Pseudomonadota bacterium]
MSREAVAALGVSRETLERLDILVETLGRWNRRINLVAPGSISDAWRRHVLDSAQLWRLALPSARHWVDLGSGGGFPGLVIAAQAAVERPDLRVTMIESDSRKAAFLTTTAQLMHLDVTVLVDRIEQAPAQGADIVSARALAPLDRLLPLAARHGHARTVYLLPKGRGHHSELTAARASWHMSCAAHPSRTDAEGVVLAITEVRARL